MEAWFQNIPQCMEAWFQNIPQCMEDWFQNTPQCMEDWFKNIPLCIEDLPSPWQGACYRQSCAKTQWHDESSTSPAWFWRTRTFWGGWWRRWGPLSSRPPAPHSWLAATRPWCCLTESTLLSLPRSLLHRCWASPAIRPSDAVIYT